MNVLYLNKLKKLDAGDGFMKHWCSLLEKTVKKFVEAFDKKNRDNEEWCNQWKYHVKRTYGSGSTSYINGWMAVFQGFYYQNAENKEYLRYLHNNVDDPLQCTIDFHDVQETQVTVDLTLKMHMHPDIKKCEFRGGMFGAKLGRPIDESGFITIRPNLGFQLNKKK